MKTQYNVTFSQTVIFDTDSPQPFADSIPVAINLTSDQILNNTDFFQMKIVETSDLLRVRIGQRNTTCVNINDSRFFEINDSGLKVKQYSM